MKARQGRSENETGREKSEFVNPSHEALIGRGTGGHNLIHFREKTNTGRGQEVCSGDRKYSGARTICNSGITVSIG